MLDNIREMCYNTEIGVIAMLNEQNETENLKCDDEDCMCCNYKSPVIDDYNFFYIILKDKDYHEISKEDYMKLSDWDFQDFPIVIKTKSELEINVNNKKEFSLCMSTDKEIDDSHDFIVNNRVKFLQTEVD